MSVSLNNGTCTRSRQLVRFIYNLWNVLRQLILSFNSSGATIVPETYETGSRHNTRSRLSSGTTRDPHVPDLVAQARMLMPADTFGHELEAMAAMINGGPGAGDDGSANGQNWSLVSALDPHVECRD
jgi:hypothetical protein